MIHCCFHQDQEILIGFLPAKSGQISLKLFENQHKSFSSLADVKLYVTTKGLQVYSRDIRVEFVIDKCTVLALKQNVKFTLTGLFCLMIS